MTILVFLAGVVAGVVLGWAYAVQKIRKAEADALDLLCARHSIELTLEEAIRRGGC